jgi:probable rRNA maturation factor
MVIIKNRQRKIDSGHLDLVTAAEAMLAALKYPHFDVSILLTTNHTIRRFNKEYRGKDAPTDILSFPYHTSLQPGRRIKVLHDEDKNLGDIIISLEYVEKDRARWKCSFKDRMILLLAHGIAHLLGYDHETDAEYRQMRKIEKKLCKAVKK